MIHRTKLVKLLSFKNIRYQRQVLNYLAGLRYVEKNAQRKTIRQADILGLHRILAGEVMDQGEGQRVSRSISTKT